MFRCFRVVCRPAPWRTSQKGRARSIDNVGAGILKAAKALGVGTGTVHRVKREMVAIETWPDRVAKKSHPKINGSV
jgi:hypothetical protein